ncbi:MAG: oligosaccharide biosynthesis protein Alg14, partial [Gammaproteobacteria bacterium]|nr:oligosaccharide biosynthesis protein Alg14 [Gammaproteobacteria bacterium]
MFIDSIANAEQLSLSGELAVSHADVMLTQWPELSDGSAIQYYGSVL